jgi:hypothetical protein
MCRVITAVSGPYPPSPHRARNSPARIPAGSARWNRASCSAVEVVLCTGIIPDSGQNPMIMITTPTTEDRAQTVSTLRLIGSSTLVMEFAS